MNLAREIESAKALLANLADIVGDDEEAKADLVEGETGLYEAMAAAVKLVGEDEAAMEALAQYISKMETRRNRYKRRIELTRTAIASAMAVVEKTTMETAFGTVTRKQTIRTAILTCESDIPTKYWKAQPPKLDKAALSAALRSGESCPGATLSNGGETVTIRRS